MGPPLGIERCGKINVSNSGSESWTGIGVVAGFWAVVLIRQGPHGKQSNVHWRSGLLQRLQEVRSNCKTRNQLLVKSLDALKPGGVMALVTSHYTLDKQQPKIRERIAEQADFLGAIRLPSDTFHRQGTDVVTDILFLKKRGPGQEPAHADPDWLHTAPVPIETVDIPINLYFQHHPEMVLGTWGREGRLYPGDYSVIAQGDLAESLREAIRRLPE